MEQTWQDLIKGSRVFVFSKLGSYSAAIRLSARALTSLAQHGCRWLSASLAAAVMRCDFQSRREVPSIPGYDLWLIVQNQIQNQLVGKLVIDAAHLNEIKQQIRGALFRVEQPPTRGASAPCPSIFWGGKERPWVGERWSFPSCRRESVSVVVVLCFLRPSMTPDLDCRQGNRLWEDHTGHSVPGRGRGKVGCTQPRWGSVWGVNSSSLLFISELKVIVYSIVIVTMSRK